MSTDRRWEWTDKDGGMWIDRNGKAKILHNGEEFYPLGQSLARYTAWLAAQADALKAELDQADERLEYNLEYFPAEMVKRDDEIAALKQELAAAREAAHDMQAKIEGMKSDRTVLRQELATAKRELGHRREGHARPDFRKEQDRRTE